MAELTKEDVEAIVTVSDRKVSFVDGQSTMTITKWKSDKIHLLKQVALVAFDVREAAEALLADARERYPGEDLKCPHMLALDDAVKSAEEVGKSPPPFTKG